MSRLRSGQRIGLWLAGLVTLTLVCAPPLDAQQSGRRRGGSQDRARLEQRVRAQMGRMMTERLGLSEAQARALSEVVEGFDSRRRELGRAEQATRRRVEALVLEGGQDLGEASQLLARMAELRLQEADLYAEEQAALLEVLTPVQVLLFQDFREQIGRRIRALRGRGNDARRDDGRGGDGPQRVNGTGRRDGGSR